MQIIATANRVEIKHQCPLCCDKHYNGRNRLCDKCSRLAFAVDLLGAVAVLGCAALTSGALILLFS